MDPQEESIGVTGVVSTPRKRRRLSPTCGKDSLEPITSVSDISSPDYQGSNVQSISLEIHRPMEYLSGGRGHNDGRFQLLAFGCNMYGQLTDDPSLGIETKWEVSSKDTEVYTDWLKSEDTDRDDTPAEPTRKPNLFTSVDTPTIVMTARESMRILYTGTHSICVERDGNIYLRGLLPTYAPDNSQKLRELAVPFPPGVQAHSVTKAFGTQWAFLGLILSNGSVCAFSLADWSFEVLRCSATENPVDDIKINKLGEVCFLYSPDPRKLGSRESIIGVYPTMPSIAEHLYDASLQSLALSAISPISTFRLSHGYRGGDAGQQDIFKSIASTSTGFIALTSNGNVYTYGDKRFNSLGRPPDASIASTSGSDNHGWGQVTALGGISIKNISANPGGHVQSVLAEDGTVYIWGGDGSENINISLTSSDGNAEEDEDVAMVDIICPETHEPVGFDGVYVGEDYVVLIEEGGQGIWVSGGSDMSQIGFGREYRCLPTALEVDGSVKKEKGVWRKLSLSILGDALKIVGVSCGSGYTIVFLDSNSR
ncbi:hypothetical protein TWF718_007501 [Orbilia javanica]|uniref:Uncharacterized protein n=1 Tax=Orbilia javanica TaxID=47235 RepID=A0AAN8MRJ8_9PEZI